jgi:hypothetical protein
MLLNSGKIMRYQIRDIIGDYCVTLQSGQEIHDLIKPLLIAKESVILDFSGIKACACPFFNCAIGQLLKDIPYEELSHLIQYENLSTIGGNVLSIVIDSAKRYYKDANYRQAIDQCNQLQDIEELDSSLFWSNAAYKYISIQSSLFNIALPQLSEKYPEMYVLFEDGIVIDADIDEEELMDRVWNSDFVQSRIKQHQSIFCHFVPKPITTNQ